YPFAPPLPVRPYPLAKRRRQIEAAVVVPSVSVAFRDHVGVIVTKFVCAFREGYGSTRGVGERGAERPPSAMLRGRADLDAAPAVVVGEELAAEVDPFDMSYRMRPGVSHHAGKSALGFVQHELEAVRL